VWSQRKGLNDFIELSGKLNSTFQIILVGLSKKQKKELPDNIIGIERTESIEELAEMYSTSDVFINPTYEDNFPTTNIEALGCGTPVITYRTGGSPEAIDEYTGLIVEQGNINKLIDAINQIKEKGNYFYTSACRQRALDKYRKEDRYQEYIELYKLLLNK
jgi:glycosyltransferase involved in cell wall biosynthesis